MIKRFPRGLFLATIGVLGACGTPDTQITKLTPDLTVAPETIEFGDVVPTFEVERTVQLINTGRATLEIVDVRLEGDGQGFTFEGDRDAVLQPDEGLSVTIRFAPEDLAPYGGTLIIDSNDEESPTLEVPVNGVGIIGPQPDISLSHDEIDFGTVTTDETATRYLLVRNEGDGPLSIDETVQAGSGAFAVITDPAGQVVNSGSEATVLIDYTPDGTSTGHSGELTIVSNDPDEPEVSVTLIGGDGGLDIDYPVASIVADDEVAPPNTVSLDGSGSTDPADTLDAYDLTYAWSLTDKPSQSHASFDDNTAVAPILDIDVAGTYEVQLIVTDFNGFTSAPAKHIIDARPIEEMYIALSWNKADADVDLHVVPTGGSFWGPLDACFCHTEPDWGDAGVPLHTGDDSDGYGPETVFVSDVTDTAFHIGVHYFEDNGGATVEATITVYLNGEPHTTESNVLIHNYFWRVGYIRIEDGVAVFVPHDEVPYFSSTRECSE